MGTFLHDLFLNLVLLTFVVAICRLCARFAQGHAPNGFAVFIGLILFALLMDAALTFLVFADSRERYGQFSNSEDFFVRAGAYLCSAAIAGAFMRVGRLRQTNARPAAVNAVTIQTSHYTQSELRM